MTDPYFDFQAAIGLSKHPGGIGSTKELAELCAITKSSYVLDVGCGVGATACRLSKTIGCRVVGIDISPKMIAQAKERARRERVEDKVEFRKADALRLPFKSNSFDAVIGESVLMFIKNRKKAIQEYRRVVRKGGRVGINELAALTRVPQQVTNYYMRATGTVSGFLSPDEWVKLLKTSGLRDIIARPHKVNMFTQKFEEFQYLGIRTYMRAIYKSIILVFSSPEFRNTIKQMIKRSGMPPPGLVGMVGYGVFVGRK